MPETVDLEAREQIAKLWTYSREIGSTVWGDDRTRDNGLRSAVRKQARVIRAISRRNRELEARLQHYLDADRAVTCPTKKLIEEHKSEHLEENEGEIEMAKSKLSAKSVILATTIPATINALLTLALLFLRSAPTVKP